MVFVRLGLAMIKDSPNFHKFIGNQHSRLSHNISRPISPSPSWINRFVKETIEHAGRFENTKKVYEEVERTGR